MKHLNAITLCTAVAMSAMASPAVGKSTKLVVTAPLDRVARHVSYADLNLASPAGETTLNRRVDVAVADLCLDATGANDGSFTFKAAMMRCSGSAWNQARPQIDRAVQRAREIASKGSSAITAAALTISLPQ
jgi:UrcA family protein